MTSRSASSSARPVDVWSLLVAQLACVLVFFATSLLVLTAAWLLVRRFRGALQAPLALPSLLLLGGVLAATLAAADFFERRVVPTQRAHRTGLLIPRALLTIAALISGISVSLPDTPVVALLVFWTLIVASVVRAWAPVKLIRRTRERNQDDLPDAGQEDSRPAAHDASPDHGIATGQTALAELEEEADSEDGLLPAEVSQRIVRARDERGAEVVYGTIRCEFATGQRQQSVHIAFCPPLESIADFTVDQVTGPIVQVKPAMVETFGAGLEVKLASPSKGPSQVQIQFFAFEKSTTAEDS